MIGAARLATFTSTLTAIPAVPAPVPRGPRGTELQTARADRRSAVEARQAVIQARGAAIAGERTRTAAEVTTAGELAGAYEALSGPMFQHPGTSLFTAAQLRPDVASLYSHLSATQQGSLARRLVALDSRTAAVANRVGVFQQQAQRAYAHRTFNCSFTEPANLAEANQVFPADFAANHFRARTLLPIRRAAVTGGTGLTIEVEGRASLPDQPARNTSQIFSSGSVPPDATLIASGRTQLPNPARYAWRVSRRHASTGITTLTSITERVVAYLHHGSLDASARDHFQRPESDSRFFATSTFAAVNCGRNAMSTFPNSPRVQKGALIRLDPFNPLASITVFQYNPETLTRTLTPQTGGSQGGASASPGDSMRLAGPPLETPRWGFENATAMLDSNSRYAAPEILTHATTGGNGEPRQFRHCARRFLPDPAAGTTLLEHAVTQGDRLDNLAARTLGDPLVFWRIANVNHSLAPVMPARAACCALAASSACAARGLRTMDSGT